jgi:hypothetical protein
MQAELAKVKREHSALGNHVLSYMRDTGCKRCETDQFNLSVSESMAQKALTMQLLKEVFLKQFPTP